MVQPLSTEQKIDQLYADWFGIGSNAGLRHHLFKTRELATQNQQDIKGAKITLRVLMGAVTVVPTVLGILAWLLGAISVNPPS